MAPQDDDAGAGWDAEDEEAEAERYEFMKRGSQYSPEEDEDENIEPQIYVKPPAVKDEHHDADGEGEKEPPMKRRRLHGKQRVEGILPQA